MRIEKVLCTDKLHVDEIRRGDCFRFITSPDRICIKTDCVGDIDEESENLTYVVLATGEQCTCTPNSEIVLVDAKVVMVSP